MSDNLSVTIVLTTIACVFAWAVWVIAVNMRRSRSSKAIAELHSRLLDRLTGSQELIAFLEGESGRRYFEALESDLKDPLTRILNGVQLGIVLILLGSSLIVVRAGQDDRTVRTALTMIGIPAIAVGAGFLVSAAVSYRLCNSWGMLGNKRQRAL
jgi:ABC-type multidrug transport system fused ATPase/permease subunit